MPNLHIIIICDFYFIFFLVLRLDFVVTSIMVNSEDVC